MRIRKTTNPILGDVLKVGDTVVATINKQGVVDPTHGYYPNHPYAKRVKNWAKRNNHPAPLY